MIEAQLIITLRRNSISQMKLYSFVHEGIEYVLSEKEIHAFETQYGIQIILKEKKGSTYDLEPHFSNMEYVDNFFSMNKTDN